MQSRTAPFSVPIMKVSTLAGGATLAFAITISGHLQLDSAPIGPSSTLVTTLTVSCSSPVSTTQTVIPTTSASSEDFDSTSVTTSMLNGATQSTAEVTSTPPCNTTTPVLSISSSSTLCSSSAANSSLSDSQLANEQHPVFSTSQVAAARLTGFCNKNNKTAKLCKKIQDRVATCIDENENCTSISLRNTLSNALEHNLCETTTNMTAAYAVCKLWSVEAGRCSNMTRGRPCAIGHVKYLLRNLRNFLELETASS